MGAFRYNEMLQSLGYKPVERELNALERFRYGWILLFIYGFTLLAMVSSTRLLNTQSAEQDLTTLFLNLIFDEILTSKI